MTLYCSIRRSWLVAAGTATLFAGLAPVAPVQAAKKTKFADQCGELRKPFSRIKNYRANQALKGAGLGALAGLATGVLVNSGKSNKSSVLPYVFAGAAAGGVIGYVSSKAQQASDRDEVQRAIASDFTGEVDNYDPLAQNIADLGNCRREQIYSVQRDYQTQVIDQAEARKRLALLETWVKKDDQEISGAADKQTERIAYYAQAQRLAEGAKPEDTQSADANYSYYDDAALRPAVSVTQSEDGAAPPPPPVTTPAVATLFVSNKSGANLRDQPAPNGRKVATIPYRASAEVRASSVQGWYEVRWNGQTGYASSSLFNGSLPPAVTTASTTTSTGKGVRRVAVRKAATDKSTPRRQVASAVASRNAVQQTRTRSTAETSAQLADLRSALT